MKNCTFYPIDTLLNYFFLQNQLSRPLPSITEHPYKLHENKTIQRLSRDLFDAPTRPGRVGARKMHLRGFKKGKTSIFVLQHVRDALEQPYFVHNSFQGSYVQDVLNNLNLSINPFWDLRIKNPSRMGFHSMGEETTLTL